MRKRYWIDDETVTRTEFVERWKHVRGYNQWARIERTYWKFANAYHYRIEES